MARGLMGLVEYRGRWQRPESISEKARSDALLAEYRDRRAKTKDDPDAQWTLALWCEENGLKAEAVAHFTAVVKRDPKRDAAWRHLGFKKRGQNWVTDAQLAEEKAEADRQKQADRHWKPLLEEWRDGLDSKSAKRRAEAETALTEVTDPRFHRFWKAGQGWVMARDLVPGDTVRTLGGLVKVGAIDASEVQPVFNLDVSEDADFFVGRQGALVHDNTLPDLRQTPFDAAPGSLETAAATARPVSR